MKKKMKVYGSHTETSGGGSWWLNTRATSKSSAIKNIKKRIKSQTDARINTIYVERKRRR